jgi:hypothetical protein
VRISVARIEDSCGFGVPLFTIEGDRPQLPAWADRKGPEGLIEYQQANSRSSLNGLPALRWIDESTS